MIRHVDVRNVSIAAPRSAADVADVLGDWVRSGRKGYVCFANVHLLETANDRDDVMRALRGADLVLPDGAPVAWLARRRSKLPVPRIAGSDVFDALSQRAATRRYRVMLVGGTEHTLRQLQRTLAFDYGVDVVDAVSPPFRPLADFDLHSLATRINNCDPDLVWVGLGAPKQELVMASIRPLVEARLLLGVGAVFDFATGTKRRAPQWMQRSGLEWFHRLLNEPKRLGRRYATTNVSFAVRIVREELVRR
jgi:N-acetylglucosaminyldiphosphoundecaprenol N-acetyl-beta-D-mannosaminyltransferase